MVGATNRVHVQEIEKINLIEPLRPYITLANVLGGFPLLISKVPPVKFHVPYKFNVPILVLLSFISLSVGVMNAGYSAADFLAYLRNEGITSTDKYSLIGSISPCFVAMVVLYFSYKSSADELTDMFRSLETLKDFLSQTDVLQALEASWKKIKLFLFILAWVPVLSGSMTAKITYGMQGPLYLIITAFLTQTFNSGTIILSPIILANYLIVDYVLNLLLVIETKYEGKLRQAHLVELDRHLDMGFHLHKLKTKVGQVLSTKLHTIIILGAVNILFATFFGTLLFTAFYHSQGFSVVQFVYGIFFVLLGAVEETRTLALSWKGQRLKDTLKKSQDHLEEYLFLSQSSCALKDSMKTKITCLTNHWSANKYLRPTDAFSVDMAGTFSMYGILLTYSLVLMQFKFGEE